MVEAHAHLDGGRRWCLGRKFILPVVTLGARTADIYENSAIILSCGFADNASANHVRQADQAMYEGGATIAAYDK